MKYAFILIICLYFASCEDCSDKPVTCAAYEEKGFSTWFPYSVNTKIIFSSGLGNDTFTIKSVYTSNSYKDRVSARNSYCEAEKSINSVETLNFGSAKLNIANFQHNDAYAAQASSENLQILIKSSTFLGIGISDTGLIRYNSTQTSQFYSSLVIGGNSYANIQMLVTDTVGLRSTRPYKIWISKNIGIVAYEEYPTKTLWIKQ